MARLISALVLVAIVVGVLFAAPWWVTVLVTTLVAGIAVTEVAGLSAAVGAPVSQIVAMASAVALSASTALSTDLFSGGALGAVLLVVLVGSGLTTLGTRTPGAATVTTAAMQIMAPLYVAVPMGAIAWLRIESGPWAVAFLLALVAISDTSQYFCGRAFGRTKLAPLVSPGKTVEGAVGGVLASVIAGAVLAPLWLPGTPVHMGALLGLWLCAFGIGGDLFESLLKRSAGVKDSSTLIPGHGGLLDRIDAHLFAAPAFVLFLHYA